MTINNRKKTARILAKRLDDGLLSPLPNDDPELTELLHLYKQLQLNASPTKRRINHWVYITARRLITAGYISITQLQIPKPFTSQYASIYLSLMTLVILTFAVALPTQTVIQGNPDITPVNFRPIPYQATPLAYPSVIKPQPQVVVANPLRYYTPKDAQLYDYK